MADSLELLIEGAFVGVSFLGTYYAYSTYAAFRHDVMQRIFGLMVVAFLLVGGVAVITSMTAASGAEESHLDMMSLASLVSFGMIVAGLIPLLSWIRGSREPKSGL